MFPGLSFSFLKTYYNQQQKPTYSAVIVINGKITPLHCLYISVK